MAEKKKRKVKLWRVIFNIIFWLIIGVIGFVAIEQAVDQANQYRYPLFGYRFTVIVTPSMSFVNHANEDYITPEMKQIQVGDTIVTQDYKSYEDIQQYDVATYLKGNDLICHRVIEKYEDENGKWIIFRGDSNDASDEPVEYSKLRGKVVNVVKDIGNLLLFVRSTLGKIIIFGGFGVIYISTFFIGKNDDDEGGDRRKSFE